MNTEDLTDRSSIFSERLDASELMDDHSISDSTLTDALGDLRRVNRILGGHLASLRALGSLVRSTSRRPLEIVDFATGAGDYPEAFIRWADRRGVDMRVTAMDSNPATCAFASADLDRRLAPRLRERVSIVSADALNSNLPDDSVDVAHSALFAHHLTDDEVVRHLREMRRIARVGVILNDLHRHPVAYHSLRLIAKVLPVSEMFAHDGPISVLRSFTRKELISLAAEAGLNGHVSWFPGFRWILTARV